MPALSTHRAFHLLSRGIRRGFLVPLAVAGILAAGAVSAQQPPVPDFFWPYGRVLSAGANISPEVQPIVAIVRGIACGEGVTQVAQPGEGVPAGDAGRTVYVVDVLADGPAAGQRPGCGRPGDAVAFYFPASGRFALQTGTFVVGETRLDLDLGPAPAGRVVFPSVSTDGPLE